MNLPPQLCGNVLTRLAAGLPHPSSPPLLLFKLPFKLPKPLHAPQPPHLALLAPHAACPAACPSSAMLKPPHQPGDRHGSPHPQHRFLHPPLENVFFCASHAPWPLMGAALTAVPAQLLWLVLARACHDGSIAPASFFCCRFMRRVHLSIPPQSTLTPQTPQPRSPSLLQTCTPPSTAHHSPKHAFPSPPFHSTTLPAGTAPHISTTCTTPQPSHTSAPPSPPPPQTLQPLFTHPLPGDAARLNPRHLSCM